jgi:hypothetical protein
MTFQRIRNAIAGVEIIVKRNLAIDLTLGFSISHRFRVQPMSFIYLIM